MGEKEEPDPFSGAGYSADHMPKDPTLPQEFSPFLKDSPPELFRKPGEGRLAPLAPPGSAPGTTATPFDTYGLNQMVDLVEDASQGDLEDVGDALWDAARDLRKAAAELKTYFAGVEDEWDGEAKKAFTKWGDDLHKNTLKLSEYAGTVGTYINAAGYGLAMVRSSTIPLRSSVSDEEASGSSEGLPAHIAPKPDTSTEKLKKREKDRKEAVQQLEKLGSYYRVALQHITAAEKNKPVFGAMPDVGVPPAPPGNVRPLVAGSPGSGPGSAPVSPPVTGGDYSDGARHVNPPRLPSDDGVAVPSDPGIRHHSPVDPVDQVLPDTSVATDIDSVAPPRTPTVPPPDVGPHTPPTPNPTGPSGPNPMGPGPVSMPPSAPPPGRVGPGGPGSPRPFVPPTSQPGRPGAQGPMRPGMPGQVAPMRPQTPGQTGPMGRPGPAGPAVPPAGRSTGPNGGQNGLRRPGMLPPTAPGGTPTAGGRDTGRGSGRASQPGGVVGGKPNQPITGGKTPSAKLPRGTVIGGQNTTAARRPTGMVPPVSGAGTGGAGAGSSRRDAKRRPAPTSGGIVGKPREDKSKDKRSRKSTPGGSGLVIGGENQSSAEAQDGEKRSTGRRGTFPPVSE
ncbi:WXG100 family type VII secretion target [Streptomyces albus]|uniref:WXG100 family type VII secretion target n=1 Tax=Streptomyces albus TaxID=1888 RepID=UPI0034526569